MPVASFFGRVKTYFIYFSENYIVFAISRTEVRFLVILGKKIMVQPGLVTNHVAWLTYGIRWVFDMSKV